MAKGTEVVVGARTYTLRYRTESITAAERQMQGESWEESIVKRGITRLQVYLWAGLRGQTKGKAGGFTLTETEELMDRMRDQGMAYGDMWERVMASLIDSGWLKAQEVVEEGTEPHDTQRPTLVPVRGDSPE
jgi:hypothetical protein